MPVETVSTINTLNPLWPLVSDAVEQGDDHLRNIKVAIQTTFPAVTGAVTPTHTVLNALPGRATALEANRARKDVADTFAARMTFTVGADAASFRRGGFELDPIGAIKLWLTASLPDGYIALQGQSVSRTDFSELFALWGTTFGVGNGSTTFTLPDTRQMFPMGVGGGSSVGSTGGSKTPTITLAGTGVHTHTTDGAGTHSHGGGVGSTALSWGQMPSHGHGVNDPSHVHSMANGGNVIKLGADTLLGYPQAAPNGAYLGWGTLANTNPATTGISIQNAGGNEGHGHTIALDGNHTHTVGSSGSHTHTASTTDGRPPFMAFYFIVRYR